MARLLTQREHEDLLADRARLEWLIEHGNDWEYDGFNTLSHDYDKRTHDANAREAIDRARGATNG